MLIAKVIGQKLKKTGFRDNYNRSGETSVMFWNPLVTPNTHKKFQLDPFTRSKMPHQYGFYTFCVQPLFFKDLKDEVTGDNKSKDRAEQELGKLREDISTKEKELEKIKPKYENMKKKEDECTRELALKEQKRKELYAKQVTTDFVVFILISFSFSTGERIPIYFQRTKG